MEMSYTIHFNTKNTYASSKHKDEEEDADGPVVERKCPQCQNNKMSYATLQLRSADEGQTVFYTCTKCKYVLLISLKKKNIKVVNKCLHVFFFFLDSKRQRIRNINFYYTFQFLHATPFN